MVPPHSSGTIAVLGECVADAFTDRARTSPGEIALRIMAGGGPANTAVALARLGTPTRFLGRLSQDLFGDLFRTRLVASGVELTGSITAHESSTLAIANLDPEGQATYTFFAEGTADWQWTAAELAAAPIEDTVCLHTGSLALARHPGGPRIEEYLARIRAHVTVSRDPNVRPLLVAPDIYRERMARWCRLTDILRLSQDDLALLLPGTDPETACDIWHAAGARLVVITLGERGALASFDGTRTFTPAPRTEVVDTVGAGDTFTAGLLHRLACLGRLGGRLDTLTSDEVADACSYAARAAALACSSPGPTLPVPEQVEGEHDTARLVLPGG